MILYVVRYTGRYSQYRPVYYAVPETEWRRCGGTAWLGSGYAESKDNLRRKYPAAVIADSPFLVVEAIRDEKGRLGFRQKRYPGRSAFVGPGDETYDVVIPDRTTPVQEGCVYEIGTVAKRIVRPGSRALRFVRVTHHPDCCRQGGHNPA